MSDPTCTCPACQTVMQRENFGIAFVDVCGDGCRGIWFDGGELARLDHERKGAGPALREALKAAATEAVERPIRCPRCDVEMDTLAYELHQEVEIDSCPDCAGVFLDAGELAAIRSREWTADERKRVRARSWRRRRRKRRREELGRRQHAAASAALIQCYMMTL